MKVVAGTSASQPIRTEGLAKVSSWPVTRDSLLTTPPHILPVSTVRSVRTRNSMSPIKISLREAPGVRKGLGPSSVAVGQQTGRQKSVQASSTFCSKSYVAVFLIIPWSQVRVLAGPPSPIEIIHLWPRERGTRVPWCIHWRASTGRVVRVHRMSLQFLSNICLFLPCG